MNIADESDEVANLRVEKTKSRRRIGLRMRRIGKVADCFEADHCGDFIAACSASAGVHDTSHLTGQKIRRLLFLQYMEAAWMLLCSRRANTPPLKVFWHGARDARWSGGA